ncbi:tyrosine-type recombinase/integrase [Actinospica sp.]|uniref:tyrosine-type recombinase/integrase n=1 Tax=Actinospica sp. TaxID=1872142 RepID=UPI002B5A6AF9|nr:tyrosine-type recombinase/integrase [Actinospica sp.]HWG23506.1 tyrosine-type recombinase/integrase [Actinospica sp.]
MQATEAIEQVTAAAERLCAQEDMSAARARQVRWFVKELRLALAHPEFAPAEPVVTAADLFQPQAVSSYLELGQRGELRTRASRVPGAVSSPASMRVREDCLKLIARELTLPLVLGERAPLPEVHETVDAPTRSQLRSYLLDRAENPPVLASHVRLLAIIGMVLDTGARVGELCALTLAELDLEAREPSVVIVRKPQARRVAEPVTERIALSRGTAAALRHWLGHREELIAAFDVSVKSLWVSVAGNHAGLPSKEGNAIRRPPGMPLRPRGLQRAYTRAVVELNAELAGSPGWRPLPYRLELLRRAIEVPEENKLAQQEETPES